MLVAMGVIVIVGVPVIMVVRMMIVAPAAALLPVRVIVSMSVVVALRGGAVGLHIGAALGIERRLKRDHPCPEALGHRLDDGIAADAQRLRQYFGRQMAVAEVPRDAGQRHRVGGPDLGQRFGLGDHFDRASVLQAQPVAAVQHCRFREVEKEFEPADAGHGHAPAIALVEVEHHGVGRNA